MISCPPLCGKIYKQRAKYASQLRWPPRSVGKASDYKVYMARNARQLLSSLLACRQPCVHFLAMPPSKELLLRPIQSYPLPKPLDPPGCRFQASIPLSRLSRPASQPEHQFRPQLFVFSDNLAGPVWGLSEGSPATWPKPQGEMSMTKTRHTMVHVLVATQT